LASAGSITEYGAVLDTSPNPTTAETKVQVSTGNTGAFGGLDADTIYYIRAYVIFDSVTYYGTEYQVTTTNA
jgi:hypothetical protein